VLDVWESEPNIDVELLKLVDIGTPHIAGYSLDGKIAGMIMIYKAACEYFEFGVKFDIGSFLPVPAIPELKINTQNVSGQDALLGIVEKIYDIRTDDARLRRILGENLEERGKYFDSLRKNYPVRREFQNTRIIVEDRNCSLAKKLKGIGFQLLHE
jgi:erythronate-4-phosphate dehydrogenase